MQYFKNPETGQIYAYEDDADPTDPRWYVPGLVRMTDEEVAQMFADQAAAEAAAEAAAALAAQIAAEDAWRVTELAAIADQLIAIEDADPAALPGTDAEWRAYRTKVRAWKVGGNPDFPDDTKRPTEPTGE